MLESLNGMSKEDLRKAWESVDKSIGSKSPFTMSAEDFITQSNELKKLTVFTFNGNIHVDMLRKAQFQIEEVLGNDYYIVFLSITHYDVNKAYAIIEEYDTDNLRRVEYQEICERIQNTCKYE